MTTLPRKLSAPACSRALWLAIPRVASTTISPNRAASANVPAEARGPFSLAKACALGLPASRAPIFTSCPRVMNALPSALPTSPVPRMPTFMIVLLGEPALGCMRGPGGSRRRRFFDLPEGEAHPLVGDRQLAGDPVAKEGLAPSVHHQQASVAQVQAMRRAGAPRLEHEAAGGSERHRGPPRVGPELRLVVGVQPHAVAPVAVAVDEDVVERDTH